MFVVDVIQRAVSGKLRFDFIDTAITAMRGSLMSSTKGSGYSVSAEEFFGYHFVPRTPLAPEWVGGGGYLDPENGDADLRFSVSGTERNSASWHGTVENLRVTRSLDGMAVHGAVREWTRVDEKAVSMPFLRVIVPGRHLYPAMLRHAPGQTYRGASVDVNGYRINFRDFDEYSEIHAQSAGVFPDDFADKLVQALATTRDSELNWVYRERHASRRRVISVRAVPQQTVIQGGDVSLPAYAAFWQHYAGELAALLPGA